MLFRSLLMLFINEPSSVVANFHRSSALAAWVAVQDDMGMIQPAMKVAVVADFEDNQLEVAEEGVVVD